MKKITLAIALIYCLSAFSMRYLVQGTTGTNTWRKAVSGEENVTLSTTFKAWYDTKTMVANDEVWLAAGTYAVTEFITTKADVSIYGSFAGTETTVSERSLVPGGKPWEFTKQTVLDGMNSNTQGLITTACVNPTTLDGLTLTRFNKVPGSSVTKGVGISLAKNCNLQNSIVCYNSFIGSSSSNSGCIGVGVNIIGGNLTNSYIHHNVCLKGTNPDVTFANSYFGGGIAVWGAISENSVTQIKGCIIENNSASYGGGGIYLGDDHVIRHSGAYIEDCIFNYNTVLSAPSTNGGGAISAIAGAYTGSVTLKNCQFYDNRSTGGLGGGAVYLYLPNVPVSIENCSFSENVGSFIADDSGNGGAALFCRAGTFSPIKNCIFKDNKMTTGSQGSAISCKVPLTIQNCVFSGNLSVVENTSTIIIASDGCKVLNSTIVQNVTSGLGRAIDCFKKSVEVTNCIFWGNSMNVNTSPAVSGNFRNYDYLKGTYNAYDTDESGKTFYGKGSINTLTATNTFVDIDFTKIDKSFIPSTLPYDAEVGNPLKGYYQWSSTALLSSLPKFDIYDRFSWKEIETSKDVYDFSAIDSRLDALKPGQRFSFRIMSLNTCCSKYKNGTEVPDYIVKEKLGWYHSKKYVNSDSIFVPDWNDAEYLNRVEKLVQALGERYDNDPRVGWIEPGLYGNWGEWHCYPIAYPNASGKYSTTSSTYLYAPIIKDPLNPTIQKYREGSTTSKKRIFNAHANAFPHKQLIQSTSDLPIMFEALKLQREVPIGTRRDSWGDPSFTNLTIYQSYNPTSDEWELINNRWKTAPFFTENWGGKYTTDADMFQQVKHYNVSAIAFGGFGAEWSLLPLNKQNGLLKCGRQVGYRYQISKVDVHFADSTFNLTTAWKNINISPTYDNWDIQAYVANESGELFSSLVTIPVNLRLLLNDLTAPIQKSISVTLNAGWKNQKKLEMRIIVKDHVNYLLPMNLDMTGRNTDGSYKLFTMEVLNGKMYIQK